MRRDGAVAADEWYDVIIVGGGSAGCVLESRLSENPGRSVLLIEAGHAYPPDGYPADLVDGNVIAVEPRRIWGHQSVPGQVVHFIPAYAGLDGLPPGTPVGDGMMGLPLGVDAREKRNKIKKQLAAGINPSLRKKLDRISANSPNTFGAISDEYLANLKANDAAEVTVSKEQHLFIDLRRPAVRLPPGRRRKCA